MDARNARRCNPDLTELRLTLLRNGYHPVPVAGAHMDIKGAGKRPLMDNWPNACGAASEIDVRRWTDEQPDCTNTGLLCGELVAVDIDIPDENLASAAEAIVVEALGAGALKRIGRAPKMMLLFRAAQPLHKMQTADFVLPSGDKARVEVLGAGQQCVAFGVHPETKAEYRWVDASPLEVALQELPAVNKVACERLVETVTAYLGKSGCQTTLELRERERTGREVAGLAPTDQASRELIEEALTFVRNDDLPYDEWIRIGFALRQGLGADGRDIWEKWSAQSAKNDPAVTAKKWDTFANAHTITVATLFWLAKQNGWRKSAAPERETRPPLPDGFRYTASGEIEYRKDNKDWCFLCSPIEITALTRDTESTNWGRLVRIQDPDGHWHEWAMPSSMLSGSGNEYRAIMLSMGLDLPDSSEAKVKLHKLLARARPKKRLLCTDRIGWLGTSFVLPDRTIGTEVDVVYQVGRRPDHNFRVQGSLEEWQTRVAGPCAGNSRLVLAICAALAGPLLEIVGAESGGFHLRGPSSIGKTTALDVAGSVWGGGPKGYAVSWRATDNGLEQLAFGHCDTSLCLDEIGQIDAEAAYESAYMLANGQGKARARKDGGRQPQHEWRVLFLSTGEISLADKLREGRRRITAGQIVRILDIPADAGAGLGLFERLPPGMKPGPFARDLKDSSHRYYGTAGPAMVEAIIENWTGLKDRLEKYIRAFVDSVAGESDGQVQRAAYRFALLAFAGEFAIAHGILPFDPGAADAAIRACFAAWLEARGDGRAEDMAIIEHLREFIQQHGASRFQDWNHPHEKVHNRVGFRRQYDDGRIAYLIFPETWKNEVLKGFDLKAANRVLADEDILQEGSDGKPQIQTRLPDGANRKMYIVDEAKLYSDEDPDSREA